MSAIGIAVISIVMFCAVIGAAASLFDSEKGLGKEFLDGLHTIGYIFVPVAGIMAAIPLLSRLVGFLAGPVYSAVGADPAMSATTFIAVDMGGYQLARKLTDVNETWIMAMITGTMAGATIVFSIPVGLAMLHKKDHPYMALGVLSGVLSIPIGVFISSVLLWLLAPSIRPVVATDGPADYRLSLALPTILLNLAPLAIIVALIALGLRFVPNRMIQGFMAFGRLMDIGIKLIVVSCIVEYFTAIFYGRGLFAFLFGSWGLDPIIADEKDQLRALEVAGYIGTMLAGAFPMVYLIKKYLAHPMERLGRQIGLQSAGAAGLLASSANILAMFRLVRDMCPKDKVLNIAFAVCAAFLFGDHLAFTANFQPTLIVAVMLGKLGGGVAGFLLACRLSVPKALQLEQQQFTGLVPPGPVPVDHPSGVILGEVPSSKADA
jgi:ethanolamine transporter